MIIISHRGNLTGPDKKNENTAKALLNRIEEGFEVEADVWLVDGELRLGHDEPRGTFVTKYGKKLWEKRHKIWFHAKNSAALHHLLDRGLTCFFHNKDKFTLTSKGVVWVHPEYRALPGAVKVLSEDSRQGDLVRLVRNGIWPPVFTDLHGICTDYPKDLQKGWSKRVHDALASCEELGTAMTMAEATKIVEDRSPSK